MKIIDHKKRIEHWFSENKELIGVWIMALSVRVKPSGEWELLGLGNTPEFHKFSLPLRQLIFSRGIEVLTRQLFPSDSTTSSTSHTITSEFSFPQERYGNEKV